MAIFPRRNFNILNCGATVVRGLGDPDQKPEEMVKKLLKDVSYRFTFYCMADVQKTRTVKGGSGKKFIDYIRKHELGDILETPGRRKFGDEYIKVVIWRPDFNGQKFKNWCKEQGVVCVPKMW